MSGVNSQTYPLPAQLTPPLTRCFQITLPDDADYQAVFFNALYELTYWFKWDRDAAHSGRIVAKQWMDILATLRACKPMPLSDGCCDGDNQLMLRQNPDNACELQSSADGIHWCTLFDVSKCTPATAQPGGGAEQPPPGGGCVSYHGSLTASFQWYLPTTVNTGDTLTFSNKQGSATDAPHHVWYCPNGQLFFAGACVSVPFTQAGDIQPTANHMTLVAEINGVWYPTETPITVPSGVSNAAVTVQMNDGDLTDNSGGYAFDVEVCNNGAAGWSHDISLALDPQGFIQVTSAPCGGTDSGVWAPGLGWTPGDCIGPGGGTSVRRFWATKFHDATHYTAINIGYNSSLGANGSGGTLTIALLTYDAGHAETLYKNHLNPSGTGLTLGDTVAVDSYGIGIYHTVDYEPVPTALGGTGLVYTLHVEGTGFDPWV